jgi:hypothetical protein
MTERKHETNDIAHIRRLLREAKTDNRKVAERLRTRRELVIRANGLTDDNSTGTYVPDPFKDSKMVLRTMVGETAKAVQHYASRVAANDPEFVITPNSTKKEITATLDKSAAEQERMDASMWEENGGPKKQWDSGMNMAIGGVSYYVTLPRDADFGLPDRLYFDAETDEEVALLRREGKLAPLKMVNPRTGKFAYAEHGDVWAARRKEKNAQPGRSLFTLEAFPRDMVYVGKDIDGIKWAAVIEEIPGSDCLPKSETAKSYARSLGVPEDDVGLFGIWQTKEGQIIGGIPRGAPPETYGWSSPHNFTKIRFFNRIEQVVLIARSGGGIDGAKEVFRGKHGCRKQGEAACPVVEVPMMRTGINVPGQEFTTPMEPVFAYVPLINQSLTLLSNASGYNAVPRWIIELSDGSILRGEDGEPVVVDNAPTPGLDPSEAAAYPGTLRQLLIDTKAMQELLAIFFERLDVCMPAQAATGEAGSSSPAWAVRLNIQQSQENLRQAVNSHADAVKEIVQMWHAWMRSLDLPVYFFSVSGHRSDQRQVRGLIEFHPNDLTDAFSVTQSLDSPEEATVRQQQGLELRAAGAITWQQFFEEYLRVPDSREAVVEMYSQQVMDQVINGIAAPPGSLIDQIAQSVQGRVHYMLIAESDNYALGVAEQMAMQAQQLMQQQQGQVPGQTTPGDEPQGNVAEPAGVKEPGMGMNPSLQGQLGSAVPGGMTPAAVPGA